MTYYLAVGLNGTDDYYWIIWREGSNYRYFSPSEDNYGQERDYPDSAESTVQVLASEMNRLFQKRAPFQLTHRQLPPGV